MLLLSFFFRQNKNNVIGKMIVEKCSKISIKFLLIQKFNHVKFVRYSFGEKISFASRKYPLLISAIWLDKFKLSRSSQLTLKHVKFVGKKKTTCVYELLNQK